MSFVNQFDKPSHKNDSLYHFALHSSNGIEFKPIASRFDWILYSSVGNEAEIATRLLFENPSTPSQGRYVPAKIFSEIFVTLVDKVELAPMKLEARVYNEAINCFSKLKDNSVKFSEVGHDLHVALKL